MDRPDVKTELSLRMDPSFFTSYELRNHIDQLITVEVWECQVDDLFNLNALHQGRKSLTSPFSFL